MGQINSTRIVCDVLVTRKVTNEIYTTIYFDVKLY